MEVRIVGGTLGRALVELDHRVVGQRRCLERVSRPLVGHSLPCQHPWFVAFQRQKPLRRPRISSRGGAEQFCDLLCRGVAQFQGAYSKQRQFARPTGAKDSVACHATCDSSGRDLVFASELHFDALCGTRCVARVTIGTPRATLLLTGARPETERGERFSRESAVASRLDQSPRESGANLG